MCVCVCVCVCVWVCVCGGVIQLKEGQVLIDLVLIKNHTLHMTQTHSTDGLDVCEGNTHVDVAAHAVRTHT